MNGNCRYDSIMNGNNAISSVVGPVIGVGAGRGMGLMAVILGILLIFWTLVGYKYKPLSDMDDLLPDAIPDAVTIKDKDKLQELADRKLASVPSGKGVAL